MKPHNYPVRGKWSQMMPRVVVLLVLALQGNVRCETGQSSVAGPGAPQHAKWPQLWDGFGRVVARRALFLTIPHSCLFLPPPHQTIWSTFSPCLRIWPILCTQFMTMARVVVGSGWE